MKFLFPLLAALLLTAACSSGSANNAPATTPLSNNPTATSPAATTPTNTPMPTIPPGENTSPTPATASPVAAAPTAAPAGSTTPSPTGSSGASASTINADNFAQLTSVAKLNVNQPQFMAWQGDGTLLVASRIQAILVDPTGSASTVYSAFGNEGIVAVSKHGQIAVSPEPTRIDVHDLSGDIVSTILTPAQFGSAYFSDDGTLLVTSNIDKIAVDIWDAKTGGPEQSVSGFQTAAPVYDATLGPQDKKLIWHARATVQVTDLATGAMSPAMEHQDFVGGIALTPDANLLATAWGSTATLWDPNTGKRIQDLDQKATALQPAFLPGNGLLVVATDQSVNLWDPKSFKQLATLNTPASQIAVSADDAFLATIDDNGLLTIWGPPPP